MNAKHIKKIALFVFILQSLSAWSQMVTGIDTLYGNEWIDFNKSYFKIKVASDGIYRISPAQLSSAGLANIPANQFRMFCRGQQVPLYISTQGPLGSQDFVEFFGQKNRGETDRFLFEQVETEALNPQYSLFNDTVTYFLTTDPGLNGSWYAPVNEPLINLPAPEPFIWYTQEQLFTEDAFKKQISNQITYSWYDGVGFGKNATQSTVQLNPAQAYLTGPDAVLSVRYACNLLSHHQQIFLNNTLLGEDVFSNAKIIQRDFSLGANQLNNSLQVQLKTALNEFDDHFLAFMRLRYPRLPQADNTGAFYFEVDGTGLEQYIEIQSFIQNPTEVVLYDLSNQLRIQAQVSNGTIRAKLPAANGLRRLLLVAPESMQTPSTPAPYQFRNYSTEDPQFLIIANRLLAQGSTNDPIQAYKTYRESSEGGNFRVSLADIEDLYDQFAYGIRFHPLAIRNFLHFMKKGHPALQYTLLIGKGLDHFNFRTNEEQSVQAGQLYFLPTIGHPAADQLFVMAGNQVSEPIMAIGRLAVTKASEIEIYLQKLKTHDQTYSNAGQNLAEKAWMKRVLHNSGGLAGETEIIKNHTSSMAALLSASRYGADVQSFYKTSNDPIQLAAYEQILRLVNGGVGIWTIFGHSSATAVDFDIGTPSVYNNKGKYPFLLVMGCFSGRCSNPGQGIGEDFLLAPDRGVIAYMASVNYSFVDALYDYGRQYYQQLGGQDYAGSIGTAYVHTVKALKNTTNPGLIAVLHQNLLQGDPAVKLPVSLGADYVIDEQSVVFDPNPVGIEQSEVKMRFDIVNLGENTSTPLALEIKQGLPNQTTLIPRILDTIPAPAFKSTHEYQMPTSGSGIGFNRFFLQLDPDNQAPEAPFSAEFNNTLLDDSGVPGRALFFFSNDVSAVYPPDFGVIRNNDLRLRASTLNTNAAEQRYLFELDTIETFDSPFKKSSEWTARGGLLEWKPGIVLQDSVVYYWRVARDSLVNGLVAWRKRSFIYLPGAAGNDGWNQSHFGQWKENTQANAMLSDSIRKWVFLDNAAFMNINVGHRNAGVTPGLQNNFYDGFYGNSGWNFYNIGPGVVIMLLNPNTGRVMLNPANGPFNPYGPADILVYYFRTSDSLQRVGCMNFIKNEVPAGTVVAMMAFHDPSDSIGYAPRRWAADSISYGSNLFQLLESQGAKEVRKLTQYNGTPSAYGLIFKKDTPGFGALDTTVTSPGAMIPMRKFYLIKWSTGLMESGVIGPAKSWKSLHWNPVSFDNPSDDAKLNVFAVREARPDTLLFQLSTTLDTTLEQLSAQEFPYLRLRFTATDTLDRTAVQPRWMRVLYEGVPEGALHPAVSYTYHADTLEQGDPFKSTLAFANISDIPMDSLLIRFRIENEMGENKTMLRRVKNLPVGDSIRFSFTEETRTRKGRHRWVVEVNPDQDQPERYQFNNVMYQDFYVKGDRRNPQLDITFDGLHIFDGDLISPQPVIILTLKDENRFLAMTDTATMSLQLFAPDGSVRKIYFSDPDVQFMPADGTQLPKKNLARLEWRPLFTADGVYRLLVNGRDAAGNAAGALDAAISFKVLTKSSISNLLNYPNPFSSSTCFVYTMSGAETPTDFRLQIMTVSGRVVREVTESEFGPLRAGTHQSDFCWDGKDMYGDQLANGVYLYRITARKADGSLFDMYENDQVDGYFKHGLGKMVLMR